MTKKLSLELDALSVESFATAPTAGGDPGTVRAAEDESDAAQFFDCTCARYTSNESCAISSACATS
jgi:hypothetical protein